MQSALALKIGAKSLHPICKSIITDFMFEITSQQGVKKLTLDKMYAREKIGRANLTMLQVA